MKNYDNDPAFKEFLAHEKEPTAHTPHVAPHMPTIRVRTRPPLQFYTGCAIIGALLVVVNTLILSAPVLAEAWHSPDFYWGLLRFGAAGAVTLCLLGAFTRLCRQCQQIATRDAPQSKQIYGGHLAGQSAADAQ